MRVYIFIFVLALISGCSLAKSGAVSLAHKYYNNGEYKDAIWKVSSALSRYDYEDEEKSDLLFIKAQSYKQLGEIDNAIGTYRFIIFKFPRTEKAFASANILKSIGDSRNKRNHDRKVETDAGPPDAELTAIYAGKTILFHDDSHGYQIEYMSADGGAYLWYPGNARIVVGEWRIGPGDRICYRYGPYTSNPVTMRMGGQFECVRASDRSSIVETLDGDTFGLAKRVRVPYKLHPTDRDRLPPEFRRKLPKAAAVVPSRSPVQASQDARL